jgi:CheY-like chemotaxis protein
VRHFIQGAGAIPPDTVLVVAHDTTNLRLARRVLESAGFSVCEATDAMSTFETLKTCRPAVIVMDIQLPGMDGWELSRRLRANFATGDIPIVTVTAFGTEEDRTYALAAGCAEFVALPISSTEIPDIVRRHLKRPPDGRAQRLRQPR